MTQLSDQSESRREAALTAVEERLLDLIPLTADMPEEWHADQADEIVALVERAFDEKGDQPDLPEWRGPHPRLDPDQPEEEQP